MKFIKKILGITELINSQNKTNDLLEQILRQSKKTADLTEKYNKAYHIN